jgi:hypothetical protein
MTMLHTPTFSSSIGPLLRVVGACVCTAAVSMVAACPFLPDHDQGADGQTAASFLAQNADFADYKSWPNVVVGTGPVTDGHPSQDRVVYINAVPADDADTFDVGTIMVKEGSGKEAEGGTGDEIHAMVKRGGSFNAAGAAGWEWFELAPSTTGSLLIKWRGEQPPDGESYGCVAGVCDTGFGGCNECHSGARANDFVLSEPLTLGRFAEALLP